MIAEMFPESYIELDKELRTGYHPELERILSGVNIDDLDLKLGHIAAYCEVVLDGDYPLADRIKLCDMLREKLILKRVNPNGLIILN